MIKAAKIEDIFFRIPLNIERPIFRDGLEFYFVKGSVDRNILKQCVETFNEELEWEQMWTVQQGIKRLQQGHTFAYLKDKDGILGYTWNDRNYTYNFFVSKRRQNRDVVDFGNMNRWMLKQKGYTHLYFYVTRSNVHVQNLFIKKFNGEIIPRHQAENEIAS